MRRFCILLVEDQPETQVQLATFLRAGLPNAVVDTASSIEEAFQVLRDAPHAYDLVILDFKLPKKRGEMPEVDESICSHLMRFEPETIVSHITSHSDDKRIVAHINRVHPASRARGFYLDKMEKNSAMKLLTLAREALYGSRIEGQIADLFPADRNRPETERARSGGHQHSGSMTNRIADLCVDISQAWPFLPTATKALVETHFCVRADGTNPSVTLRDGALSRVR
jgi:DNA-binding NarL/FixJ family response regulator